MRKIQATIRETGVQITIFKSGTDDDFGWEDNDDD